MRKSIQYQAVKLFLLFFGGTITACSTQNKYDQKLPEIHQPYDARVHSTSGYETNFYTGDTIAPLVNNLGDTLPSDEWIEFSPKFVNQDSFKFPPVEKELLWTKPQNAFTITDSFTLSWTSIEPDSFWVDMVFHEGDSVFLTEDQDTITTGEGIPFKLNSLQVTHPEPIDIQLPPINLESRNNVKNYRSQQGMLISYVSDVEVLSNGEIWLATRGGKLWRISGKSYRSYGLNELGTESVHTLKVDDDGNLWIIAMNKIILYNGKEFGEIGNENGFFTSTIRSTEIFPNGDVWVGIANYGFAVYREAEGHVIYLTTNEGLPFGRTSCAKILNDSTLMVGTWGEGIYQINVNSLETKSIPRTLRPKGDFINHIMKDSQGRIWVSTFGQGTIIFDSLLTEYSILNQENGLPSNKVLTAIEKENGDFLLGTKTKGFVELNMTNNTIAYFGKETGHLSDDIRDFEQDQDGNIWTATWGNGLLSDYGLPFKHVRAEQGIMDDRPTSILEDHDGNYWLTVADKGLFFNNRSENQLYQLQEPQGMSGPILGNIFEDSKGYIYVSGTGRGFMRISPDRKSLRVTNIHNGLNNGYVHGMLEDEQGNIWFGTATGFTIHNPDSNTSYLYGHENGVLTNKVTNIIKDQEGVIWMSTRASGALRYKEGKFSYLTEKEGLISNYLNQVLQDKEGRIWFASDKGVCMFDNSEFVYITESNGLTNNNVKSLLEDDSGRIWAGTANGLNCISTVCDTNGKNHLILRPFLTDDGLVGLDFKPNGAMFDSFDNLWWCTENGLTTLNQNDFKFEVIPSNPVIREVFVNGVYHDFSREVDETGIQYSSTPPFSNCPANLVLDHSHNHLTFEFGLKNWITPENTYFTYRLASLNEDWSPPSKNWSADYRNIPYGKHLLEYSCWTPDQGWSKIIDFQFTVTPPWYQTLWAKILYGLIAVLMIWLYLKWRTFNLLKKQQELEEEVDRATMEIRTQHEEIMDSLMYAKRIQTAILPPQKLVKEYLENSFILYKPKDIVAGDFYWMEQKEGKILFAAADCTGHGVPGAMVSVICNGALNRSVREFGLSNPAEILDKARDIVVEEFEKSDEEVKDGMDIALCSLELSATATDGDISRTRLMYAGAHNPLWIVRKGQIIETKANKQPIGKFDNPLPYTNHTFELESGDTFYIFSDGFVDQFGGEKGKKFKAQAFRELLIRIQDKSMAQQKLLLDEAFETWRGKLEQIDDVCVIGVRV